MIPPTHFAAPQANVPAETDTPLGLSRDTPSQAIARALNQPVRVVAIDEDEGQILIVEPLHFHRVVRRGGSDVVCKSHVTLNSQGSQRDLV